MIGSYVSPTAVLAAMLAGGLGLAALRHVGGGSGGGCCTARTTTAADAAPAGDCCASAPEDRRASAADAEGYVCPITGGTLPCPNCCPLNQ